jgi:pyridoxal kinase
MTVIAIQSQVVHGHVGNSAAVFALQASGIEVAAVPTVLLSNHPRYSSVRGRVLEAALVRDLLAGVEELGLVESCQILISGYLGSSPEIACAVIDFVGRAKARNPRLLYLCDPIMGDDGRIYVSEELRALLCQRLVPLADIITPNQFELKQLAGGALTTVESIIAAARVLEPSSVAVTGASQHQGSPADPVEPEIFSQRSLLPLWSKDFQQKPRSAGQSQASTLFSKKQSGGTAMRWASLLRQSGCCGRIACSRQPLSHETLTPPFRWWFPPRSRNNPRRGHELHWKRRLPAVSLSFFSMANKDNKDTQEIAPKQNPTEIPTAPPLQT